MKKKILLMSLFFIVLGFVNCYAIEGAENTTCRINSSQATEIRFRVETNGTPKYGYLYQMTLGNGMAFCLDPGLKNNTNYTRGNLVTRNTYEGSRMYRAYQFYLEAPDEEKLLYAQIAIWYFAHLNGQAATAEGLAEAFLTAELTKQCNTHLKQIQNALGNPYFSCDCFNTAPWSNDFDSMCSHRFDTTDMDGEKSESNYIKISQNVKVGKWANGQIVTVSSFDPLSLQQYVNAVISNGVVHSQGITALRSYYITIAERLLKTELYEGDLYFWEPSGGSDYQKLIGIAGCGPEDVVPNCDDDLNAILTDKKYDTLEERKGINEVAYLAAINALKLKYPTRLNIEDIYNPTCKPSPGPDPDVCLPYYRDNACSFDNPKSGFEMRDNGSPESDGHCWLDKNRAYDANNKQVTSLDENFSTNAYCDIYCWEAFGSDFPGAISGIKAGTTFFWGRGNSEDGYMGNLNARRYCKTVNIDYNSFANDWAANETEILKAYNAYKAQEAYNNQTPQNKGACELSGTCSSVSTATTKCTATPSSSTEGCTGPDGSNPCFKVDCSSGVASESGGCWCSHNSKTTTPGGQCVACSSGTLKNGSCKIDGTKYSKTKTSYGTGINIQYSKDDDEVCIANSVTDKTAAANTALNGDLNSLNQKLVAQIEDRKTISRNLEVCQTTNDTINKDTIFTFASKVVLKYQDAANVNRNIPAEIELVHNAENDWKVFDHSGTATGEQYTYTCTTTTGFTDSSGKCGVTINKYSEYHWDFKGVFKFYYPYNEFYWKSIVENAHVVNEKTYTADYSGMKIVPYTVGYGIPTAFSLKTGYYNISVDVTGFGNNGTHFSDLMTEKGISVYNYSCPYYVINELYGKECNFQCDPDTLTCTLTADSPAYCDNEVKGIDLVYRVIEMASGDTKTIFPSIDGDGRNPGANWSTFIANNNKAYKNITTPSVIYDDEPIYEIDLTPTLINQIRRDNLTYREQNMDPYTSYTDANNQEKVICEGVDTNRTCASHYITELINQNVLNGEYADCHNCGSTAERLKYIDSMKERYNN